MVTMAAMARRNHKNRQEASSRAPVSRRLTFSGELLSVFTLPNLSRDAGYGEILSVYGERALNRLNSDMHG